MTLGWLIKYIKIRIKTQSKRRELQIQDILKADAAFGQKLREYAEITMGHIAEIQELKAERDQMGKTNTNLATSLKEAQEKIKALETTLAGLKITQGTTRSSEIEAKPQPDPAPAAEA